MNRVVLRQGGGKRTKYVTPGPWGLVVDEVDCMEAAMREVYCRVGVDVVWVDHDMSHYVRGTNVVREVGRWW
jgi:hypothetical protein